MTSLAELPQLPKRPWIVVRKYVLDGVTAPFPLLSEVLNLIYILRHKVPQEPTMAYIQTAPLSILDIFCAKRLDRVERGLTAGLGNPPVPFCSEWDRCVQGCVGQGYVGRHGTTDLDSRWSSEKIHDEIQKRILEKFHSQRLGRAEPAAKRRLIVDLENSPVLPRSEWVDEQTSLNSSRYGEERRGSNMYALATPISPMSRDVGNMVPCLWLDSGASSHMVGDSTILINLRDVPIGRFITTADGSRLAVAKVGDIQTPDIRIQDVLYVHGLQMNLVSVRQLGKNKVVTTFYENHAELWSEGEQIGGAVVDDTVSLYKLRYLH